MVRPLQSSSFCGWKDYQKKVLDSKRNQVLCWARRTGKTTVLIEAALRVALQEKLVLFDVHDTNMCEHVLNMLRGDYRWSTHTEKNIIFAKYGTISRDPLHYVGRSELIIFDEIVYARKNMEQRRNMFWLAIQNRKRMLISSGPGVKKEFDDFCKNPPRCFDISRATMGQLIPPKTYAC